MAYRSRPRRQGLYLAIPDPCTPGYTHQLPGLIGHIAYTEHAAGITIVSAQYAGHIHIDYISAFQNGPVGMPWQMTLFIDVQTLLGKPL